MEIFLIPEYIGIASASLSGFLFAVRRGCDWLGIFLSAFLTALGGGLIRDAVVGRAPYSFTHYMPVLIVLAVFILAALCALHKNHREGLENRPIFIISDAIDLVSFSIVGAIVALEYGLNFFGVIFIAFANGCGGGILRDILLNEVPWLLKTGFYGTISFGVGAIYFVMHLLGFTDIWWIFALFGVGVAWRVVAFYGGWSLPQINYKD